MSPRKTIPLANHIATAMRRAALLSADDRAIGLRAIRHALAQFRQGLGAMTHWRSLADCANMTETLADMGLGRVTAQADDGSAQPDYLDIAQQALADVHGRHARTGSWTLRAPELQALRDLVALHELQLAVVSYGELETAYTRTARRIAGALSGSPAKGARVIAGEIQRPEAAQ